MTHLHVVLIGDQSLLIHCGRHLLERGHVIDAVLTEDAAVRRWAEEQGLDTRAPKEVEMACTALRPDYLLSIANLRVVPGAALSAVKRGAINFHDGPLPEMAGLNTPVWALLEGHDAHGISWHRMEGGVDAGAILVERRFPIGPDDTTLTLNSRCFEAAIASFPELLEKLERGDDAGSAQRDGTRRVYRRDDRPEAGAVLRWDQPAEKLVRLARALDHGAGKDGTHYANHVAMPKALLGRGPSHGVALVGKVERVEGIGAPGTVLASTDGRWTVACADGAVALDGLVDPSGAPIESAPRAPGEQLPVLSEAEAAELTSQHAEVAPHEGFWRRRLTTPGGARLPFAPPKEGEGELRASLDGALNEALAALAVVLLRAGAHDRFDLGYRDAETQRRADAAFGTLAAAVPLRLALDPEGTLAAATSTVEKALERTARRGTHAVDLVARTPGATEPRPEVLVDRSGRSELPAGVRLALAEDEAGRVELRADASRISASDLERLAGAVRAVQAAAPDTVLREASLVGDAARARLLAEWIDTHVPQDGPRTLVEAFDIAARRHPDSVALVHRDVQLTYRELHRRVRSLALRLTSHGVGPGSRVGIHTRRSADLVVAVLAVLESGAAYVPLDPTYPRARVALMLEDSGARLVLADAESAQGLPSDGVEVLEVPRVARDGRSDGIADAAAEAELRAPGPDDLAYVIYTSGSTGKPKGVMVEHRNVLNFFRGMDQRIGEEPGTWLAVTSLSFDISVLELLYTLCRGYRVVLASDEDRNLGSTSDGSEGAASSRPIDFSLFYFASDEGEHDGRSGTDKYRLLLEGAKFGDRHGFAAVWTPERHFHAFGGLYPNPSVISAAIAATTERIRIRAGSCVLPLHHPARVAEEWALVDNLSNGRVDISFAAGWQPNDFVLRPAAFGDHKEQMFESIEQVRALWRGETLTFEGPKGPVEVRTLPRPIQSELPFFVTAAGNPATFEQAGRIGAGLLTHLLGQTVEELTEKIALYRKARREAGHEGEGHVVLMLHTFVGDDDAEVRELVRGPMKSYLGSSLNLIKEHAWSFPAFRRVADDGASLSDNFSRLSEEETDALLEFAFERYYETSGLFGTPERCQRMVEKVRGAGVDEIGCLIDFGIPSEEVLSHLAPLARLRERVTTSRVDEGATSEDHSLAAQIRRHQVTHLQCTPSMARMLVTHGPTREALRDLRCIMVGGEALPGSLVEDLGAASDARILNMYGPTETTIWSTTQPAEPTDGVSPIGTPIANTQVYVLDRFGGLLPEGFDGELWIGGDGVTRGYHDRPELTAERFRPDPFTSGGRMYRTGDLVRWREDGVLLFLGRIDHQVKVRGHRIELGEIETALERQLGVEQAAVLVREDRPGDVRLVAYVTGSAEPEALRDALAESLPSYMVPQHVLVLPSLPLTPNGKVDRNALPAPDAVEARPQAEYVAPEGELESELAAIWQRLLGVPRVGLDDSFFALGGHSLLAVEAHRAMGEVVGDRLSVTDLFRFPTLRALSAHLSEGQERVEAQRQASVERASNRRAALNRQRRRRMG